MFRKLEKEYLVPGIEKDKNYYVKKTEENTPVHVIPDEVKILRPN